MKAIIIGASLSGKTTLVRYLRNSSSWPIEEMDEALAHENGGTFPVDVNLKHKVLAPRIIDRILKLDSIVFFTNTDYFTIDNLKTSRENGFVVVQLDLPVEQLKERNVKRMEVEDYEDQGKWIEGMNNYQKLIRQHGLVDKVIPANQTVEDLKQELQEVFQ